MKKRLRKKKHVGEFREFGFAVRATLRDELTSAQRESFFDRWIDALEARGLNFGGGGAGASFEGFVARVRRGNATKEDRRSLGSFLGSEGAVIAHEIEPLADAWR